MTEWVAGGALSARLTWLELNAAAAPLLHRRGWKLPVQGFTADGLPKPAASGEPEPFEIADMWCAGAAWGGELPGVGGNSPAGRCPCSLLSQRPQMTSPLCLLCPLRCRPYWLDGWDPSTVHNSLSLDVRGMGLGGYHKPARAASLLLCIHGALPPGEVGRCLNGAHA